MADRISREQRSKNMSAVRSSGNYSTELALQKIFRREGISGWRRNKKILGISPDFVFPKSKVIVFIHGCFWHGCKKHRSIPLTNRSFWLNKIENNAERDIFVIGKLRRNGWSVLVFWEHDLRKHGDLSIKRLNRLRC